MDIFVPLFHIVYGSYGFTGIQGGEFLRVCDGYTFFVDSHPTFAAVCQVQYIIYSFSGLCIGQFGGVQHFCTIREGEEGSQVKVLVLECVA